MFEIAPISKETFPELLRLVEELADYEKLDAPDESARQRLYDDCFGEKPKFFAVLVFEESQPVRKAVAYAIYFYTYSSFLALPSLYLEDLFVSSEMRKKGAGREVFKYLINAAKENSCGRIEWQVLDWNKIAIDFYERLGANKLKEWYTYRITSNTFDDVLSTL